MKSLKTLSILFAGAMAVASCEQAPKSDDAKTTDGQCRMGQTRALILGKSK